MRKCADRAREFSNTHRFSSFFKSRLLSQDLVVKQRKFQPERRGLGVNAVRSSDNHCGFELECAFPQHREQPLNVLENDGGCIPHLERHCRIQHIRRSQPKMEKP